jgi:hypothetical protein
MKASIIHDEHGKILSIAKIGNIQAAGSKFHRAGLIPGPGQLLTEVELSTDEDKRPLRELHEQFHINLASRTLVPRKL